MGWVEASLILFGGLVAIMGLGLPVAFAFLALNIVGAWLFLGGDRDQAAARNAVQSVPLPRDPCFVYGRGCCSDRRRRSIDASLFLIARARRFR